MRLLFLILVVCSLVACTKKEEPVPVIPTPAPTQQDTTVAGLSPEVTARVMKYRLFFSQEICFNFGCSKSSIFFGQVHQESRWVTTAQSKYAAGIAQFTPDTAKWINQLYAKDLKELCLTSSGCPLDPKWALRSLTLYMKQLYASYVFSRTDEDRFGFSLAAYNGGAGWIPKERKKAEEASFDSTLWFGGVALACVRAEWACKENREYPDIILHKWKPLYMKLLNGG